MKKRRWLHAALAAAILVLAGSWGLSLALKGGWARRSLLARVSASFGRPVEVGQFDFSLLNGPRLEAHRVTVAEDPRFGDEYFLRAQQLTVSVRWTALLRGRFEFATLSFSQPSLNLVRAADGRWNIQSWLPLAGPPSGPMAGPAAASQAPALRLARVEIDGGRINFKRGTEKLPIALVDLSGRLERDSAGRWNLDLAARPARAPIVVQDAGTLRLRGSVAGTSTRLRPATLQLSWEQASLADALRLSLGSDHSVRGTLAAEFSASLANPLPAAAGVREAGNIRADDTAWTITGTMRLAGVHSWNLAGRDTDPAANVSVSARWQPGQQRLEITQCVAEAPHSWLDAIGALDWSHGPNPSVRLVSARVGLGDLLAWRRAFLPGVADDLVVEGTIGVDATLAGWPLHIEQGAMASTGAVLRTTALPGPVRIARMQVRLRRGSLELAPVSVELPGGAPQRSGARNAVVVEPPPAGALRVEGALGPLRPGDSPRDWRYALAVAGQTVRAQDLLALAAAFGGPRAADWAVEGGIALQLHWTGALRHGTSETAGTIGLRDLRLTSVAVNEPLLFRSASVELRAGERSVKIAEAQGFGATWKGMLDRHAADRAWTFDLAADALDVAELDRWLGPRARPGLLARMLPFAAAGPAPPRDAAVAGLAAQGRLRVAELTLDPLRIARLDTQAEVRGRSLLLRGAQADFYAGRITGEFGAQLAADPEYTFRGQIDRFDLAELADPARLAGRVAGSASGELSLAAHGVGREKLLATIAGEGALRLRDLVLHDASAGPGGEGAASGATPFEGHFAGGTANFRIAAGRIIVDQLSLADRGEQVDVEGSVDFARGLDLRVRSTPRGATPAAVADPSADPPAWVIAGTLDAMQMSRPARVATGVAGRGGAAGGPRR